MKRRTLIIGAGAAAGGAGCVSLLRGGDDGDSAREGAGPTANSNTSTNDTRTQEDQGTRNTSNESSREENTTNETTNTSEEERNLHPDENETEIDEENYNRSGKSETVELPRDSVEVKATYHLTDDESGVIVTGDIKNVTSDPIDFVDLRVLYYNSAEEKVGEDFVVKRNFAAKQMKTFEVQTPITEIRGDVAAVGGIPVPQNYADS